MVQVGVFARTFDEPTLEGVLDAIMSHGIKLVHFNLRCAGLETVPEEIGDNLCEKIRYGFAARCLKMIAISGTYNMIDPDVKRRESNTRRACHLIERARDLGSDFVTLCTGTRDPNNMWQAHLENNRSEAWRDLIASMEKLIATAETHDVTLGIEPEKANVIDSAVKARQLLNQLPSDRLKIVIDGANLFKPNELWNMREVLVRAFDLLGPDIAMAHAKDITNDRKKQHQAAGTGRLDWNTYFECLQSSGCQGPVVLHNLAPSEVDQSVQFVRRLIDEYFTND